MRFTIVTVGRPRNKAFARAADDYVGRLDRYGTTALISVKPERRGEPADQMAAEAERLLDSAPNSASSRIALDRVGDSLDTETLARRVQDGMLHGDSHWAVFVGGPHGIARSLIDQCDWSWSLGPGTLPHELALVVAAEQLYRAMTIIRGEPYHK